MSSLNSPRLNGMNNYSQNEARVPTPQNFVVTGCYSNKIKFSWSAVSGQHNLFSKFEYQILSENNSSNNNNNQPKPRKITSDNEVIIENLIPGQDYRFYVRAIETQTRLESLLSSELDIRIPKDNKNNLKTLNTFSSTPRAAKWKYLTNENKILITWKSPHYFYGDVSYELLFNNKVLGRCYVPPLILSKKEIETFDFRKGIFKLRSIIISSKDNKKQESNSIPIPYPNDIRQYIEQEKLRNDNDNDEKKQPVVEQKQEEMRIRNDYDDSSMIYVWVCAPDPMPDLKLIPYGDPDFSNYSFKKLDSENGIYLCSWPSHFINELDHYFLFGVADPKINLAAMPTFDQYYKGYWICENREQIKFFVVYTHKVLHRFAHAIAGGVQGMHHKYKAILNCIVDNIDINITFKSSMHTIITMHKQWETQASSNMGNELQDIFFNQLEHYADTIEYYDLNIKQISVILLSIYWLLTRSHHKVHYRHLHHALQGLLTIIKSKKKYNNVIDLISEIMGKYVIDLLKLFQSFAIEKLKKDRSRYFDLVWYQIIYLSTIKVINDMDIDMDIDSIHNEFMLEIDQILFNPNCLSRPIGNEDLQSITTIYIGLLKPFEESNGNNQFYKECGIKLEELLIENHIKCEDILDTIEFINKYKLSYYIFAAILYRNQNCYTFAEYSDGKQYLPELNIASDQKTHDLLSKYGKFTFIQQQKIPKHARCCLIHLIFNKSFKNNIKDFDERKLFFWFNVIKKLILKYKDFNVSDQILYELKQFNIRINENIKQQTQKYIKQLPSSNMILKKEFETKYYNICLTYQNQIIPNSLFNNGCNSKHLYGILTCLLYFRHCKIENIDNENKDDFSLHLFGILMLQLNELYFAEKYLMKAILKRPNNPYGHYYTDLSLLYILKNEYISAFNYITIALNKKHTELYNKLILLVLYNHLIYYKKEPTTIPKQFDLNNIIKCNHFDNNNKQTFAFINNNNINQNEQKLINKCLSNYYNALKLIKLSKFKESMKIIDEIYKYINNINIKQIKKICRQVVQQMENINDKNQNQNEALIKIGGAMYNNNNNNNNNNNKLNDDESKYNDDEQKEESPQVMYLPPNDDNY